MNIRDYINSLHFNSLDDISCFYNPTGRSTFVFDARIEYFHRQIRLCFAIHLVNQTLNMNKLVAVGCMSKEQPNCCILIPTERQYTKSSLPRLLDNILFSLQEHISYTMYRISKIDAYDTVKQSVLTFFEAVGYEYSSNTYKSFYTAVSEYQNFVRSTKLKMKHKKECDFVDDLLKKMPEPTKAFYNWLEFSYMSNHFYFFYKYANTCFVKGICSVCGNTIELLKKKNNEIGICPHCGKPLRYRSNNRKTTINANGWVVYPVIVDDVAYIRVYKVYKDFYNYKQKISLIPKFVAVMKNQHVYFLTYQYFRKYDCIRWGFSQSGFEDMGFVLRSINKDSTYNKRFFTYILSMKQYSAVQTNMKNFGYTGATLYKMLMLYDDWVIESLSKIGNLDLMHHRESQFLYNYSYKRVTSKNKLHQELGIRKGYARLIPILSLTDLGILQELSKCGIYLRVEVLKELLSYSFTVKNIMFILQIGFDKVKKYLSYQIVKEVNKDSIFIIAMYREYISHLTLSDSDSVKDRLLKIFPNDLKLAYNSMKFSSRTGVDAERVYNAIQGYKNQYNFEYGDFIIKAPNDLEDIDREGTILSHCLSRYAEKVQCGLTAIVFLRKKEDIDRPFYTLECNGTTVLQCKGFNNKNPTEEVQEFLVHYKNYLQNGGKHNGVYS